MNTRPASINFQGAAAEYGRKYGILIALLLVCAVLSFLSEFFLTQRNILNVLRQASINGILAIGMTFLILAARTGSALTQAGIAYELDAIAAVVIGGTSLSGGVGRVTGTLIGALLISVVNNGLDLMGVESYYQQVIKGVLIVGAVMLDQARHKHA
jgi:ribose/xylose/arabinose/galactoside ABC-type transport system permease subunit